MSTAPQYGQIDKSVYQQIRTVILDKIDAQAALSMDPMALEKEVARVIAEAVVDYKLFLNSFEQNTLTRDIVDDMVRLGPVQPCMDDPEITDILINGPYKVIVERKGKLEQTNYVFRDIAHLQNLAQRIASAVGRRVDESSPMVDARLADGSRVNIIAPPLCLDGISISIRKFHAEKMSLENLESFGAMSSPMRKFLEYATQSRLNILVSGGTGAGKTTLLNALSQHIGKDERIITVEDAAELKLDQPMVTRLETRPPSIEGKGEVTQRDLIKNALRMRPDRILLGEVRGEEALDMLQAMNTGHDGSLSTVHANTPTDAMLRLENMLNMGTHAMASNLVRKQLSSAIDLLVQIERDSYGHRHITNISEVCPSGDNVICNDLYTFNRSIDGETSFIRTDYMPSFMHKFISFGKYNECMEVLNSVYK